MGGGLCGLDLVLGTGRERFALLTPHQIVSPASLWIVSKFVRGGVGGGWGVCPSSAMSFEPTSLYSTTRDGINGPLHQRLVTSRGVCVVVPLPSSVRIAYPLYVLRGACLLLSIAGGRGQVQPQGLSSFDNITHMPFPEGLVIPGVINHDIR